MKLKSPDFVHNCICQNRDKVHHYTFSIGHHYLYHTRTYVKDSLELQMESMKLLNVIVLGTL